MADLVCSDDVILILKRLSPYAGGGYPFVEDRLSRTFRDGNGNLWHVHPEDLDEIKRRDPAVKVLGQLAS